MSDLYSIWSHGEGAKTSLTLREGAVTGRTGMYTDSKEPLLNCAGELFHRD